jgi:prevent-host-death family protein
MAEVSARDLRNHTRDVLKRVEGGEQVDITVNGQPVAELHPVGRRQWVPWRVMREVIEKHPADPGLLEDIRSGIDDETFEDPWERDERRHSSKDGS